MAAAVEPMERVDHSDQDWQLMDLDVDDKQGKSVQILDLVISTSDDGTRNSALKLDSEKLHAIFKKGGDRPAVIISIAGPCRKGKSLFLCFVLRYLKGLETGEPDWIGYDQPDKKLEGFLWGNGYDIMTSGIWIWDEPFFMRMGNGTECAVFVMDTQGVFDEHTSERDWCTIIGLSLLTSSTLIFNLPDLNEDTLLRLDSFLKYGLLVSGAQDGDIDEESEDTLKPFQKLLFLLRDWYNPGQFSYGYYGGKEFLTKKLDTVSKDKMPEDSKIVRRNIKRCFEELECCLLPSPGEKAKTMEFTGALKEFEKKFVMNVDKCITQIINPDNVKPKMINGVEVTANDFIQFFTKYVEIFNSEDTPSPMSILEATTMVTCQKLLAYYLDQYNKDMMKQISQKAQGNTFIIKKDLQTIHDRVSKKTLEEFQTKKNFCSVTIWNEYAEKLHDEIGEEFKKISESNRIRMEIAVERHMECCIEDFENGMKNAIDDDCFLEAEEFQERSEEFEEKFKKEFLLFLGTNATGLLEAKMPSLESKILKAKETLRKTNGLLKAEAEKTNEEIMNKWIANYVETLEKVLKDKIFVEAQILKECHDVKSREVIVNFRKEERKGSIQLLKLYDSKINHSIELKFATLSEKNEENKKNARIRIEIAVVECMKNYESSIEAKFQNFTFLSDDELEPELSSAKEEALNSLAQIGKSITSISDFIQEYLENLEIEIRAKKLKYEEEYERRKGELKSKIEEIARSALLKFNEAIDANINSAVCPKAEEFEEFLKEITKDTLLEFSSSTQDLIGNEKALENLKDSVKNIGDKAKDTLILKIEHMESSAKNYITDSVDLYKSKLLPLASEDENLAKDESELGLAHEKYKKEAKTEFLSHGYDKDDEFTKQYLEQIESEVEEAYVQFLQFFKLKLGESDAQVKAELEKAKTFYHEEMEKHVQNSSSFLEPKVLEGCHHLSSRNALKKVSKLTKTQEKELYEAMDKLFISYKEKNDMNTPTNPAIGIDLGTTYSCVAVYLNGRVEIIPNEEGHNITPSYVAHTASGELVGDAAKANAFVEPENTIYDVKRLIGRQFNDKSVQDDIKSWPFEVVEDKSVPKIKVNNKEYYPEEISAAVLKKMKRSAELKLGREVKKAVITVPAYFTDGQKQATIDAGVIAGLEVLKIIHEPTAAAVAYRVQHKYDDLVPRTVLVYDLGGGTFDVALLTINGSDIKVKEINGDTHLGGEDFDQRMVNYCVSEFFNDTGVDLRNGEFSSNANERHAVYRRLRRIRQVCEKQKCNLSSAKRVEILVDNIHGSTDLKLSITRDKFEELNMDLLEQTISIVEKVLTDTNTRKDDVDDIVLVGGSTRIPKVQEMLSSFFSGKTLNKSVHQDEAVAYGAAVQAAMINGEIAIGKGDYTKLTDVTPRSLGIEVYGGGFSVIIPKSTPTPLTKKEIYRTAHDNQTSVNIIVFEGEEMVAVKNTLLGQFYLNGVPPADAGLEEIQVDMNINDQGILHVTAVCVSTGGKTDLTIREHKLRLSKETIQKILDGN